MTTAPPEPRTSQLAKLLEKFVSVVKLTNTSSNFTHEGTCTKCGWHTMQLSEQACYALVRQHVQTHWRDITNQL